MIKGNITQRWPEQHDASTQTVLGSRIYLLSVSLIIRRKQWSTRSVLKVQTKAALLQWWDLITSTLPHCPSPLTLFSCSFCLYLHLHLSVSTPVPPSLGSVKSIWESCRLGCLLERPTTVPSPSRHLLVPLQSAAGLPTGQFRWSAVSCHRGHPPWLPLKDNGTVSVTSGSLLYTTPLLHVGF